MRKIHKTIVRICTVVAAVLIPASSTILATAKSNDQNNAGTLNSINSIEDISTYASLEAPTVNWDNSQYNMVVRYDWRVGRGGDELAMSKNWQNYVLIGDDVYRTDEFPEDTGTNHCDPYYFLGKSYNSSSETYSYDYTSLEHDVDMGEYTLVRYGYDSKYTCVGRYAYWGFSSNSTIPTSYDQDHYLWYHHSSNGHTIKGTISYKGQLSNIEVAIPWIGYKTTSVTINGETFYLRTGPNKCSIKAGSSNIRPTDVRFAFGIA